MSGTWSLAGTYLESCNWDVICPCRRIGGRAGGRSTYGICEGALSWAIERGRADDVDLAGLAVVLALRYDDDEPGSPPCAPCRSRWSTSRATGGSRPAST